MTKAGRALLDAAREMTAIARGEAEPRHVFVPTGIDVKSIRRKLGFSQQRFAAEFGFTLNQIRDWEQGRTAPVRSDRAYLLLIDTGPDQVMRMLADARVQAAE
jgi:putative transcriptional regulator